MVLKAETKKEDEEEEGMVYTYTGINLRDSPLSK